MQWCEYLHVKKERGRDGDEMKEEEGKEKRNEQSSPRCQINNCRKTKAKPASEKNEGKKEGKRRIYMSK